MKVIATETVFTSKNFQIKRNTIERNGKTFTKDFIDRNSVVLVIPYQGNEIYMESQFRDALGTTSLEIVSGNMEASLDPFVNAKRELKEETGLVAQTWTQIGEWDLSVSMKAKLYVFAATDLQEGESHLEFDEEIEVIKMPLEKVIENIDNGQITGASHIAALLVFKKMKEEGKL